MANSFVKWCRAKFFNGYKHINVLAQEEGCGRSDTETLVRAGEEELFISTPTPTPAPTHAHPAPHGRPPAPHHPRHPLAAGTYVVEVSCDVSVAAGDLERQEFSFTLYDFDGHGKVTKDDIAGLVRTIYEAVGSSLSLPPSGSRTIKVKLTVAPESSRTRPQPEDKEAEQEKDDEDEEDYEDEDGCGVGGKGGQRGRRRGGRRRSTSLQRHELLQIIQANMEKNNLFYTPLHRPHHPHYPHHHSHPHHHHHHHPRRRRPRPSCPCSPPDPAQVKARLMEPDCPCRQTHYHSHTHGPPSGSRLSGCRKHHRSHSHDLTRDSPPHVFRAHLLEKAFHPLPPSNTPDQPPSPPTLPHHHHHHSQPRHHHHHHHHHRSRSYDGGDTQRSSPRARITRGSRCTQQDSPKSPPDVTQTQAQPQPLVSSPSKESPRGGVGVSVGVSGGVDGSPNPPKHRHRAAEHDRAMAQVVAWLERGTLLDPPTPTPCSPTTSPNTPNTSPNATEQTHHVHQHIHHHYHHYGNQHLPPLVL
ncbi:protein naked cuticle homolog 2-like [Eriocheir sinensis]|uniref:protein naked cuticle homolog 2-like n=1 Tax=Eriocheir sinensis TaxID=95602 RepID=UPI0021C7B189|nr:protein naked cuticle homolog 2-like [Eriocheir sinensis]